MKVVSTCAFGILSFLCFAQASWAKLYVCEGKTDVKQTVILDYDKNRLDQVATFEFRNHDDEVIKTTTYYDVYEQVRGERYKTFRIDRKDLMISMELVLDPESDGPRLRYVERTYELGGYRYGRPQGYFPCKVRDFFGGQ